MSTMNKQLLQDLMQNIEARKQTEQRLKATDLGENQALGSVRQPDTLRLQMGVLLARSENQILVLETLLKRLVQVCVHTQDKRLAKELKLMDFTRLAKKIGDEHTHMRQMLIHEDGMLGPSPAESFLMDPLNSGANTAMNMQNGAPRLEDSQLSAGANAVNLSQYRSSSQSAATQHAVMQQQMLQQQKQGTGPQGQHMSHLQPSQAPPLSQAPGASLRRDASGAPLNQSRDPSLQLRNLWSQDGGSLDGSGLSGMPGGVPNMQGLAGQTNPLLMGGRGGGGMHMSGMMRSTSAAGSGLNNPAPSVSGGGPLRGYNDNEQPFGNFP